MRFCLAFRVGVTFVYLNALAFVVILSGGCEKKRPAPANTAPQEAPLEIDLDHMARIKADRRFSLTNIVLIVQADPAGGSSVALSLGTSQPLADGSRMIFAGYERGLDIENMSGKTIDFGGSALLDPTSNGIYAVTDFYQPKNAVLTFGASTGTTQAGTIEGDFYHFRTLLPGDRPKVVPVKIDFKARLIIR